MIAKTISGASELLHVSQPGVSRALKYIEMKLGMELFERRQNGLVPTPEAEELFAEILPLYNRLDDLDNSINRIVRAEHSYVQIGCTPGLAHYVLPLLLLRAKKDMPDVVTRIDTVSNEELADYVAARRGEFALSTYDPNHPLILAERSISGHLQCVVHRDHVLAKNDSVSLGEVVEHELVAYYDDTWPGRVLNDKFEELGLSPKVSTQVRFNADACAMVEHGLGVGFAYDLSIRESMSPMLRILPLKDKLRPMTTYLLRHRGYSHQKYVRQVYESMADELNNLDMAALD